MKEHSFVMQKSPALSFIPLINAIFSVSITATWRIEKKPNKIINMAQNYLFVFIKYNPKCEKSSHSQKGGFVHK